MSFIFEGLFGGGDEKIEQKQTTTPQYPEQSLGLFDRELALLENVLFPLQQQLMGGQVDLIMGGGQDSPVLKGAGMAGPAVAGLPGGASGSSAAGLDATLAALLGQLQGQAPGILAQQVQSLMPPQYAQLFQPSMRTETETEEPGPSPFEVVVGLGSLATPLISACWVADALYGEGTMQAKCARLWVTTGWQGWQADAFRALYYKLGPAVAALVKRSRLARRLMRPLFDRFVTKGWLLMVQQMSPMVMG